MLANAAKLCEASSGAMWLREGDAFRAAALHGPLPPAYVERWRSRTSLRPAPGTPLARVAESGKPLPPHSITSSERNKSEVGTSRPSALAVFMLVTTANLVACSTGMSAGLAPL
jgi:hypothetical protein